MRRDDAVQTDHPPRLSRRDALLGASSLSLATLASPALADTAHEHAAPAANTATRHRSLVLTALECVGIGQMCLQHCFQQFAAGDTSLAVCAMRNQEMIAACQALATLAAASAAQLTDFAQVCIAIYKACEDECRKHHHHAICMETAQACAKTIAECEKLTA